MSTIVKALFIQSKIIAKAYAINNLLPLIENHEMNLIDRRPKKIMDIE